MTLTSAGAGVVIADTVKAGEESTIGDSVRWDHRGQSDRPCGRQASGRRCGRTRCRPHNPQNGTPHPLTKSLTKTSGRCSTLTLRHDKAGVGLPRTCQRRLRSGTGTDYPIAGSTVSSLVMTSDRDTTFQTPAALKAMAWRSSIASPYTTTLP